jgi:hypothetical protein
MKSKDTEALSTAPVWFGTLRPMAYVARFQRTAQTAIIIRPLL